MQVQDVQLNGRHGINIPLDDVERDEMAADVDHQAAPGETRLVFDVDGGRHKTVRRRLHELKEGLEPVKYAERVWGGKRRARGRNIEGIAFVFSQFLDRLACAVRANGEQGFSVRRGSSAHGNTRLTRKIRNEALNGPVQSRIGCPLQR